jgi:hypothetical protein
MLMMKQNRSNRNELEAASQYRSDNQKAYRKHVLGLTDEDEDMGDIQETVTIGDTHHHYHGTSPESVSQSASKTSDAVKNGKGLLKTGLVVAATLGGGAGAGTATKMILDAFDKPAPTVENPVTNPPSTQDEYDYKFGFKPFE